MLQCLTRAFQLLFWRALEMRAVREVFISSPLVSTSTYHPCEKAQRSFCASAQSFFSALICASHSFHRSSLPGTARRPRATLQRVDKRSETQSYRNLFQSLFSPFCREWHSSSVLRKSHGAYCRTVNSPFGISAYKSPRVRLPGQMPKNRW